VSAVPRTLLLAGTPPNPDGVGGIILADLCEFLPPDSVRVACIVEGQPRPDPVVAQGLRLRSFPVDFQRRPTSRFGLPGRAVNALAQTRRNRVAISRAVDDCVRWAREEGVGQVWAVLDSPLVTEIAAPVAERLGVPLRTTVWDDVHHNNRYYGLDRFTARRSLDGFAKALRKSSAIAAIGESMREEYRRVYGVESVVVRHGVAPDRDELARPREDDGLVRIGFAGSISASSAFELLLKALDGLGWRLGGREVCLRLLGHRFDLRSPVPRHVECFGWRSVDDTIRLLGGCDFNYLPQPFEADWAPFTRLSFPSKLTTYLATGRPMLLHAPPTGSLVPFNERYGFARACTSLDREALVQALQDMLDPAIAAASVAGGRKALAEEFTREHFRESFARFLGVDSELLRA